MLFRNILKQVIDLWRNVGKTNFMFGFGMILSLCMVGSNLKGLDYYSEEFSYLVQQAMDVKPVWAESKQR